MDASAFAQEDGSHFFKFILEDTICLGKLMLPRNFAEKFGHSLPSVVTLELPTGAKWQVELLKNSAREIWFDKGFKQFALHCSLRHGNVVVFKYDKKSLFHVQVFEGTGLQIAYPGKPAVEVKTEQAEDFMRYGFETSRENGVERAPKVEMEDNEDGFKRAPKVSNERAREGVKIENVEKDSHRVKKASKGTTEKDGAGVSAQPIIRRSGRLQTYGVSSPNNGKTLEEIGDETETDDDEWGDDDDVDACDVESIDDDSEDEDYLDITMDDDDDDDDDDYDSDYAKAFQQRSGRKKPARASKPSNGTTSGNGKGKRGEMEEEDEDVDEDYLVFLDATFG